MMLMAGMGLLAAAVPLPQARANPADRGITARCAARCVPAPTFSRTSSTARTVPAPIRRTGRCRAGRTTSCRRSMGYTVTIAETCSSTATPISSSSPRDDLDDQYFTGKLRGNWRVPIGHTWEARIKLDCMTPGLWPSFWAVNEDPLPDGEVDVFEWYGNDVWPPGTTVHAASNGKTWEGRSIPRTGRRRVAQLAHALGRRRVQILARLR